MPDRRYPIGTMKTCRACGQAKVMWIEFNNGTSPRDNRRCLACLDAARASRPPKRLHFGRKWWPEQLERAAALLADSTYSSAARVLGCSKNSLIGAFYRHMSGYQRDDGAPIPIRIPEHWFADGCRWVIGEPSRGEWRWCGAEIASGSWCAEHAAIGYRNPHSSEDLKRFARVR